MNSSTQQGFYTALGTPLDDEGNLHARSMSDQIEMQIEHECSGLLAMGSMGIESYLSQKTYPNVARHCASQVRGRVPLYIGVTDVSIRRVLDRVEAIGDLQIDGIVATVPYYHSLTQEEVYTFYRTIAEKSNYPLYLYDLAAVTKTPISAQTVIRLKEDLGPAIGGIKSAQLPLIRTLRQQGIKDLKILYSGLDTMDIAYEGGIKNGLDGMFCVAPKQAMKMFKALQRADLETASTELDTILSMRDTMISFGVFPGFTALMNKLGMPGNFHPDYCTPLGEQEAERLEERARELGII